MFLAFKLRDLITIPFGYLMDWLYQITGNYGVALILFAIAVQLILLPLYTVVREPIVYMLHENADVAKQIVETLKNINPDLFTSNAAYEQIVAARYIPEYAEAIKAAIPTISERALEGINFGFAGINLGGIPQFNIFASSWAWDWAHIGALLIALLSAGNQVITMLVSQKLNNSVITNEKGVEDEELAKNSQAAQTTKTMMFTMPLMMLWIGFTVPAALSLYWFIGGIVRTIEDSILTIRYRKIYDAEDAIRLERAMEAERIEAEKERIRAEKRAANPDGITQNTSKKKLQKQQRDQEAAEKAAAAKEYAAMKGIVVEEEEEDSCMSGIPSRPFCKGRNYDPNRYNSTEE